MKNMVYLIGLVVVALAGYNFITKKDDLDSTEDIVQNPIINPTLQTQPQQNYPLQAIVTPRVDNADQPWYSGTRSFFGESNSDDNITLSETKSDNVMTYNTNAFWTSLESKYTH